MIRLSTVSQIVESILTLGKGGECHDAEKVANAAVIYLKTAMICESDDIEAAMEYFTGTHDEDEYKEYLSEAFMPEDVSLCKKCDCMTHTVIERCGKCGAAKEDK